MNRMTLKDRIVTSIMLIGGGILIWAHWPFGTSCDTFDQERAGYNAVVATQQARIEQLEASKLKIEVKSIQHLAELKKLQQEYGVLAARNVVIPEPRPMTNLELTAMTVAGALSRYVPKMQAVIAPRP